MNAAELDRIEASLGVTLPGRYRATMLAYPFASDHEAAQRCMPDDLEFVLEQTQIIRPGPRHAPWPPEFVVIGTDGSGELFVLDAGRTRR